jgi:two-component system LytT family response regulator
MLIDDSEIDNFINQKMIEGCNFAGNVYVHTSSKSALEFLKNFDRTGVFPKELSPEVIFLDINMPGRLGFDLMASVPFGTRVVFVTAHEDRALDAFRAGAVDYVLKPVDRDRLAITIDRLEALVASPSSQPDGDDGPSDGDDEAGEASGDTDDSVTFSADGGKVFEVVPYADIVWIEALQNYSRLQLVDRKPVILKRTLTEWESLLPAEHFGRISRSVIIQLTRLRSSQWQSRDETLLAFDGIEERLPIGRSAAARLKELFRGGRR